MSVETLGEEKRGANKDSVSNRACLGGLRYALGESFNCQSAAKHMTCRGGPAANILIGGRNFAEGACLPELQTFFMIKQSHRPSNGGESTGLTKLLFQVMSQSLVGCGQMAGRNTTRFPLVLRRRPCQRALTCCFASSVE